MITLFLIYNPKVGSCTYLLVAYLRNYVVKARS
jgi:hypothetical protein